MKTTLTNVTIEITEEEAKAVFQSSTPLEAYRDHLISGHSIAPNSVSGFDLDNLKKSYVKLLGERELVRLGFEPANSEA